MTVLGPHPPRFPIGTAEFDRLRRDGLVYVDKTRFIASILARSAVSSLFPRPRRFGKTLNLSMLRCFLERTTESRQDLFEDTWIWSANEGQYRQHFQRYPVIALTLKDVKAPSWAEASNDVQAVLRLELDRLIALHAIDRAVVAGSEDERWLEAVRSGTATRSDWKSSLSRFARLCEAATGERVVILIDEYDAPLHAAYEHGYWDEAVGFFRDFLSAGLKDQPHLFRGVLTGILKVAKENIFSGLNNVDTSSIFDPGSATHFGFTEAEVIELAEVASQVSALPSIRAWYNGYLFGGPTPTTVYNPWSVLQYLSKPERGLQPFWKNTSSNALVRELLLRDSAVLGPQLEALLSGESVSRALEESVPLSELSVRPDAVWSLLTYSGYLTADAITTTRDGIQATLRIPNEEVATVFRTTFSRWLENAAGAGRVEPMVNAMLSGDVEAFEAGLEETLVRAMSSHDFGARPVEAVYHAFIIGLLLFMERSHRVVSNRESGFGRADVLILPRLGENRGAVLELKTVGRSETPQDAMDRALEQIRARAYAAEVREAGAQQVFEYGVVFDGKRCWVSQVLDAQ